jgi:protoporphyrinogen oxidase
MSKILIIGAGYTGLAAGVELDRLGVDYTIVDKQAQVGGLSRSFFIGKTLFELGPHIYFDKDPDVTLYWQSLVGGKFKSHKRNNRIYFDGRFIKSPLNIIDATIKIGLRKIIYIFATFFIAKLKRQTINSAEDWVIANFGKGLFKYFFKVYNEKIWGLPCNEITANWAGQRIKSNLLTMLIKSIKRDHAFVVKTFDFPEGGSVTLCEAQLQRIKASKHAEVKLGCMPMHIDVINQGFNVSFSDGSKQTYGQVIATCHLSDLATILESPQLDTQQLQTNINKLMYRNLVLVNLVFDKAKVKDFKEHWIDIHDSDVKTLRVTNFSNYELDYADNNDTGIGLEYNCFETDTIWHMSQYDVVQLALDDLKKMGLVNASPKDISVLKFNKAYPVYYKGYEATLELINEEFAKVQGLQLAGRNAMYRWNNMHHSVKTGILAARNCAGESYNLSDVRGMVAFGKDTD